MYDFIPKIYVCTIDKGSKHFHKINQMLVNLGINPNDTFINAPKPLHKGNKDDSCSDNHLTCIKDAIKHNYEFILILEDDVIHTTNMENTKRGLQNIEKFINNGNPWDIIFLGHFPWYMKPFYSKDTIVPCISWQAHSLLIHKSYYSKLATLNVQGLRHNIKTQSPFFLKPFLPSMERNLGIDTYYSIEALHKNIKSFIVQPRIMDQTSHGNIKGITDFLEKICWCCGSWLFLIIFLVYILIVVIMITLLKHRKKK